MKGPAIAAAILATFASAAWAQAPGVPEQKCEPKPTYPGLKALPSEVEAKALTQQMAAYKECILGYISERKSAAKAHNTAADSAATEYNKVMEKFRSDQEASRQEVEKSRAADKKDTTSSPSAPRKY